MQDKTKVDLVSTEVAGLWNLYINDSMAICVLKHFLNTLQDEEIRHILQKALDISNGHLQVIKDKFNQDGYPIPKGFNDEDINTKAPKLFTDSFYLFYLLSMSQLGMNGFTLTLNHIGRPDLRDFFSSCVKESIDLFNITIDALQQQGLYIKSPRIEFAKDIDYIDKKEFFSGGILGKKRSLIAREITVLFASLRQNIIGAALITGFGQVAQTKKISDFFFRGRDLAWKKIKQLSEFYIAENIPVPSTSDSFVTDSTISPFSDRLMTFHVHALFYLSIIQDGNGFASSLRHDLQSYYSRSLLDTSKLAGDGLDILIENRWMEQPPQAIAHSSIAKGLKRRY